MKLAVILVHYHSLELAQNACSALRRDAEDSGIELETVLVDNGSCPEDLALLDSLPARRLDPGRNLGYAGGTNYGVQETSAEFITVMNPDVEVLPGCLGALIEALQRGAAAAGPLFFWDHDKQYLLPPTEPVSRVSEVLAVLARRSSRWAHLARRRWRRHAHKYWSARQPLAGHDLSGALLAFRRSAWQRVGPFDEGYRLYYEETDWLERLRRAGLRACFVPSAEAVHFYAQSTISEPRVEAWRLDSSRRFRRKAYGARFTQLIELLSDRLGESAADLSSTSHPPSSLQEAAWQEISPSPLGFPAAACRLPPGSAKQTELPSAIYERLAPGTYYLRSISLTGRELGTSSLEKTASSEGSERDSHSSHNDRPLHQRL